MALRYAPARALANPVAGPPVTPVQDLVAEGPGTLRPAGRAQSAGAGRHDGAGWSVVVARPLPDGLGAGARAQIALAVWQGERQEVGPRKMRTGWIPLIVGKQP
jgi:DMSO reductase family type II enzyme heme b subunit